MSSFVRTIGYAVAGMIALSATAALAQDKKDEKPKADPKSAAQDPKKAAKAGQGAPEMTPEQQKEMEAWMKYATPGENHKLLEYMVGDWSYTTRMWDCRNPDAPPQESSGIATARSIMGGRYFISEHSGQFMGEQFEGIATTGYDNHRKKFVGTWIDNLGTGILNVEGTYDPSTKTFTYTGEMDDFIGGGPKIRVREVIKVADKDKHTMEWYETRDGKEVKVMEITYSRKK